MSTPLEAEHPIHLHRVFVAECEKCQEDFRAMRAIIVMQDDGMFDVKDVDDSDA